MKTTDNETFLIDHFREMTSIDDVVMLGNSLNCKKILTSILDGTSWNRWTDSSGKDALPPDFYNNDLKIMMEVMRVDDHSYRNQKGQIINPTLAKEKSIFKEFEPLFADMDTKDTNFVSIVDTGLPTFQDHNYDLYFDGFKRVINKHADKVELYRKNHFDYKLVFFVYDESTAYLELPEEIERRYDYQSSEIINGTPHYYFLDRRFVRALLDSGAEYVVWFAPYKMLRLSEEDILPYPKAVIFDLPNISIHDKTLRNYSRMKMISSEL